MATKPSIKNKIKKQCEAAGTFESYREQIIDDLTFILHRYEKLKKEWKADGEPFVTTEVNTKGEPYTKKDSRIDILNQLEKSILDHYNALGLTVKSTDDSKKTNTGCTIDFYMQEAKKRVGQK